MALAAPSIATEQMLEALNGHSTNISYDWYTKKNSWKYMLGIGGDGMREVWIKTFTQKPAP